MSNTATESDTKPAIANDGSFVRRVDWLRKKTAEIEAKRVELKELSKDEVERHARAMWDIADKQGYDFLTVAADIDEKHAEAAEYCKANKERLMGDATTVETKNAAYTLKNNPPALVVSEEALAEAGGVLKTAEANILSVLVKGKLTRFYKNVRSLDKPGIKKALKDPNDKQRDKLEGLLKMESSMTFTVGPKKG